MFLVHFFLTERSSWNILFISDVDVLSSSVSSARSDYVDEKNEPLNTGSWHWKQYQFWLVIDSLA